MSNGTPLPGVEEWKARGSRAEANWYLTFISIVFGVFISVWIEPIVHIFPATTLGDNPSTEVKAVISLLITERALRGAVMFVMLICLWWWYGTFLGRIAPARSFWSYLYDFISLSAFAVAFRMWDHPLLFPMIVFLAAALMLGRFATATGFVEPGTVQFKALITALIALLSFMLFAAGAVALVYYTGVETFLNQHWSFVQTGTLFLLLFGIGATFAAVTFTDGLPFREETPSPE